MTDPHALVERLREDAEEIAGWGAGNEAGRVREAAATITRLTEERDAAMSLIRRIAAKEPWQAHYGQTWEDEAADIVATLDKRKGE